MNTHDIIYKSETQKKDIAAVIEAVREEFGDGCLAVYVTANSVVPHMTEDVQETHGLMLLDCITLAVLVPDGDLSALRERHWDFISDMNERNNCYISLYLSSPEFLQEDDDLAGAVCLCECGRE